MKKTLSLLLAFCMLGAAGAGCSSSEAPSSSGEAPVSDTDASSGTGSSEGEASFEGVTLRFAPIWAADAESDLGREMIAEFQEKTGMTIEIEEVAGDEMKNKIAVDVAAGNEPDVWQFWPGATSQEFAKAGVLANVEEYFAKSKVIAKDHFSESALAPCTFDGQLLAVPRMGASAVLMINTEIFEQYGQKAPTTWDELKDVAQKTTQGNVTGFAMCCLQNEEGTFNFTPWLWSTGATSYDINNDNGIKALTLVKDLVDAGSMSKEVINWTQGDVMNQFISGNIAMMVNGPWQVPTMREQAPDLNWDVTLLPKDAEYASCLGGENFGVIDGDNVDAALDFLQFATSKDEVASYIDDFGYIAARKDVAEGQFTDDETMQKFTEEMQYAQPRGPHAQWPEISDALSLAVNESITGTSTPADAAAKAQSTIDGILAE